MKQLSPVHSVIVFLLAGCLLAGSCRQAAQELPADVEVATAWADLTNYITKNTPGNSPTFASRAFGYIGLTMYESVVYADSAYQSVAPQLNGLGKLDAPEPGKTYHWPSALNAGQAAILRSIYIQTPDQHKLTIDSLEKHYADIYGRIVKDDAILQRSVAFGRKIAQQIFEWSKTDGGHRGYLRNFDKQMVFPETPGSWQPPLYAQSISHYPLHPHWGKNRTFLALDSAIADPVPIPYDTLPGSAYYQQFLQVYEKNKSLTQDEKEAAIWWGDDPDITFTPPGHSYYLATIAARKSGASLVKAAETFARTGMAVADAFRNCWKWKYRFFTERANTFIPQHIDRQWESFWPDPPFPAFPSGHAIQAAAAATVLTDLYGERFAFTDSSHLGREKDEIRNVEFKARHFRSFWEVAEETALSRFYGGIHVPHDNEAGLEKGREIALNVNRLNWKKPNP